MEPLIGTVSVLAAVVETAIAVMTARARAKQAEEMRRSVSHLRSFTSSADRVVRGFQSINAVASRAQRASLRSHQELLQKEGASTQDGSQDRRLDVARVKTTPKRGDAADQALAGN